MTAGGLTLNACHYDVMQHEFRPPPKPQFFLVIVYCRKKRYYWLCPVDKEKRYGSIIQFSNKVCDLRDYYDHPLLKANVILNLSEGDVLCFPNKKRSKLN